MQKLCKKYFELTSPKLTKKILNDEFNDLFDKNHFKAVARYECSIYVATENRQNDKVSFVNFEIYSNI